MKYTVRGFKNGKTSTVTGTATGTMSVDTAKSLVKAVKREGMVNVHIVILEDDNSRRIYEGLNRLY